MPAFDYEITIPGEHIAVFRELLTAGIDALGDSTEDIEAAALGREILAEVS